MEPKLNLEYLERLDLNMLRIVKVEAEKLLEQKHATESIINSKVIGMLQFLFPVFVGILGVVIDQSTKTDIKPIFLLTASLMDGVVFVSCLFFYRAISVHEARLIGARPSRIVNNDMTSQSHNDREVWFLRNRIFNIENDICVTDRALNVKTTDYENGYSFLLQGSMFVTLTFFVLFAYLNFFDPSPRYPHMDFVKELVAK